MGKPERERLIEDAVESGAAIFRAYVANDIRADGWIVAAHYDYRVDGDMRTFWLFAHPKTGRFVKGEGMSDAEALDRVRAALADAPTAECARSVETGTVDRSDLLDRIQRLEKALLELTRRASDPDVRRGVYVAWLMLNAATKDALAALAALPRETEKGER